MNKILKFFGGKKPPIISKYLNNYEIFNFATKHFSACLLLIELNCKMEIHFETENPAFPLKKSE